MPAPIVPAPTTATVASLGTAAVIAGESLLPSGELRRPFRGECSDSFAIVSAFAQRPLQIALEIELGGKRVAGARVERPLDRRESARGRLRELLQQLVDDRLQFRVL